MLDLTASSMHSHLYLELVIGSPKMHANARQTLKTYLMLTSLLESTVVVFNSKQQSSRAERTAASHTVYATIF